MVTETLNNPFADFGGIVYGDRFIGREKELSILRQRVLGKTYGNMAIIGLPRVGKSSLVWHAIIENKEELKAQKTISIFFEAGHCSSSTEFFSQMVNSSFEEVEDAVCEDNYERLANCVGSLKYDYDKNVVQHYFKIVKKLGYKTIFIIDEFDRVRSFFGAADFQLLRELSYNPDTHLCLVTTSRQRIEDIEVRDGAISNFSGIFSELYLKMFNQEEVDAYWKHFSKNCSPEKTYKDLVAYYSGNHPYLMDLINNQVFFINNGLPSSGENGASLKTANVKLELMEALDKIVHTLEEEKLLNPALQLVLGPLYDVNQEQVEKLLKYGVVRKVQPKYKNLLFNGVQMGLYTKEYAYLSFSDYSSWDMYRRYCADVPYFTMWGETENLLRSVVKGFLSSLFPGNWEKDFKSYLMANPPFSAFKIDVWENNLEDLKKNKQKMIADFPTMSGGHLVDFTLTNQIFSIFIRPAKQWFNHHIFTGTWDDWNKKFDFLTKLRNPIAHNNPINLDNDIFVAKKYCADISKSIKDWQAHSI